MRGFSALLFPVLVACLSSCSNVERPALGTPVPVELSAGAGVAGPRFSKGADGQLILSWMETDESATTLRYSPLVDGEFSNPVDVVTESRAFVNWADLPSVMPLGGDHWIAHWLRYSAEKTYSYDVVISQSFDGGMSWGEAMTAHTDNTPTEHGFVSIAPDADGAALLWLDGRNTPEASMTLRSAVITPDGRRTNEQLVDASVCDCCQTDIAIAADGPVAVYRDRTSEEVRDIYVTRYIDGQWTPGVSLFPDNWTIAGCPVNGPSIVAEGEHVAVAWFTVAFDKPVVRVVTSIDGGATFGVPTEIASGRIHGYVGLAMIDASNVAVSWVGRNNDGSSSVLLRQLSSDGRLGPPISLGQTRQLRVVPQLAYADGYLYAVWTDDGDDARRMKSVRVPVTVSRRNQSS